MFDQSGKQAAGERVSSPWDRRALLIAAILLGIPAIYLRFANLADNPGWDGDEGYNWNIAANLAHGHVQMFGLRYTFVQHPPLFYLAGAALLRLWDQGLLTLRVLSATCGIVSVLAVFALGHRLRDRGLGLCAALFLIIWPQAVVQERWAYTYNLLALLVPAALWAALRANQRSQSMTEQAPGLQGASPARSALFPALIAGLLTGLALATDQEAVALVPAIAMLLWPRGLIALLAGTAAAALPPGVYVFWMLIFRPHEFLFDIRHSATRLDFAPSTLVSRFWDLLTFEPLIALGIVGLVLLPRGTARRALLLVTGCFLLIVLAVRDPAPYFRAAEPLLPLAAVGVGAVVQGCRRAVSFLLVPDGMPSSAPAARRQRRRAVVAFALLVSPFAVTMLAGDLVGVRARFKTAIDPVLPRSAAGAHRMADWVNRRVSSHDLVLVMADESWLFHCRTADLLQAVAISGTGTSFYPSGLAGNRFAYSTRLSDARFLIVDDFTKRWIAENPRERQLVVDARLNWNVVYREGEYAIYGNPDRSFAQP